MPKRPIKPTKLRALEGGRSHSLPKPEDVLESEPQPRPKAPKCPPDLDKEAKKAWRKLAPTLERLGLLTEADGWAFANLCQIRSRLVAIHKFLKRAPALVQDNQKPSPLVVLERQYYQIFRMYAAEFGLTPRGRVGLVVGSGDDDDGEDFLS